jgi:hypothetical protein
MADATSTGPLAGVSRHLGDAALALGLGLALLVVGWLEPHKEPPPEPPSRGQLPMREISDRDASAADHNWRLAVTPPRYDDMGRLLDTLGKGYQYDKIPMDTLFDSTKLKVYDAVFFTCDGFPASWMGQGTGKAARPNTEEAPFRPEVLDKVRAALRDYVEGGGTLYVSDWRFPVLAETFREFVDDAEVAEGQPQTVQAQVVAADLRQALGADSIELNFDQPDWFTAAFQGADCEVLLRGRFRTKQNDERTGPLLVRFRFGQGKIPGTVVFTSFHNEKENTDLALKLLRFLVFTTVLGRSETLAMKTLAADGFQAKGRSLLSVSQGDRTTTNVFHRDKQGRLRMALTLGAAGAKLRFKIVDPAGLTFEKEVTASFVGEVDDAVAGDWTYSVTAIELPYPNFPFSVSIGAK